MDVPMNNPAGRLYNIIDQLRKSAQNPYLALSSIFNIDSNDRATILENYAEIFRLTKDVRECILKLDGINHSKYLSPIEDIILSLSKIEFSGNGDLFSFKTSLDEKVMIRLEYCAEALSSAFGGQSLEESQLEELSDEVESLINYIKELNINNDLKAIFLNNLENIKIAITKYQLYGPTEIKSILEACLGSIILNGKTVNTDDEKSGFSKIYEFIYRFNQTITFNNNINTTLIPLASYLLGLPHGK
jgi:hypothetical protein